jgi:hypothetical protein
MPAPSVLEDSLVPAHVVAGYLKARRAVLEAGYGSDIDWAEGLAGVKLDPQYVLREGSWVILNSGFRATVARKLWPGLSRAFHDWVPERITGKSITDGLLVFNHFGKIEAMAQLACIVRAEGIERIRAEAQEPLKLRRLPWVGDVTCWHLAKLLGADVVKPDVHLRRAAAAAGFDTPLDLCKAVQQVLGDRLTVIDSVFWRYGERQKLLGWEPWSTLFQGQGSQINLSDAGNDGHEHRREGP